ncbi:MAG: MBL fold metallo-hydrolase [Alphaproteobacteria bacterium CG_4_9_14_3_um_filter_47_13]|nr:MAG: MBL fold metallo-hydrolase [Alphaproteobacteria bacterium CG_4_9_14_3_um_filter_47_13]
MKAEFILLGCSVSSGVPAIGNDWGVCDPHEPKNRRDRPCAVIRTEETTLIIDTGPDFRSQLTRLNLDRFDAVLYTHAHSDHIMGIDELRVVRIRTGRMIDIFSNQATIDALQQRFDYMFEDRDEYHKVLIAHVLDETDYGRIKTLGDIPFTPFFQNHGNCDCVGYRFGNIGYSADMLDLDDKAIETLRGIDVWIADGAGYHKEDHVSHAPLSRLYALNEKIKAKKVYVAGLSKFMDYQTLKNELPQGFEPSYDGLTLNVEL